MYAKGMYLSRTDGDILTHDLRMRVPNRGIIWTMPPSIRLNIYLLPCTHTPTKTKCLLWAHGCRTGFYLLTRRAAAYRRHTAHQRRHGLYRNYNEEIPQKKKNAETIKNTICREPAIAKDMQTVLAD